MPTIMKTDMVAVDKSAQHLFTTPQNATLSGFLGDLPIQVNPRSRCQAEHDSLAIKSDENV